MIEAADIIAALKVDHAGSTLKAVEGAMSMPQALDKVRTSPTAFVLPPYERALDEDAGTAVLRQKVNVELIVLVVWASIAGAGGSDVSSQPDQVRDGIKNALLGKELGGMTVPIALVSAGPLDFDFEKGTLLYQLIFTTGYTLRRNA